PVRTRLLLYRWFRFFDNNEMGFDEAVRPPANHGVGRERLNKERPAAGEIAPRRRIDLPGEIQENPARLLAQRAQQAGQEALLLTAAADDRQVGPESGELELGVDAGLARVP